MSNKFYQVPTEIIQDPRFQSSRTNYQRVFWKLCEVVCYKDTEYAIGSKKILLKRGQFCTSIDQFVEICNKNVRFKEDLIDRNIVSRAIAFFCECQFVRQEVRQEVRHKKSILTILWDGFSEKSDTISETISEQQVRQNRDNNKDRSIEVIENKNVVLLPAAPVEGRIKKRKKMKSLWIDYETHNFQQKRISIEDAWKHFLKKSYPNDVVKQAMEIVSSKICKTNCIEKYIEGICKNIMKEQKAENEVQEKIIPIETEIKRSKLIKGSDHPELMEALKKIKGMANAR